MRSSTSLKPSSSADISPPYARTHPREVLYPAIQHLALGFLLAHNHPSGCLDPSDDDVEFTRAVGRAGQVMGIELYDHLIVAASGYLSLRERGMMP